MMKNIVSILAFAFCLASAQDPTRVCSDHPTALPSYNSDWYYYEFTIPENVSIQSTYGGFTRTSWYTHAEHDYIAQYFQAGLPPTNLDEYQLWNYDTISVSMYNREWDISSLGLVGGGIMRISAPLTHFVTWHEACVSYATLEETPAAVPEPGTLVLSVICVGFLGVYVNRRRLKAYSKSLAFRCIPLGKSWPHTRFRGGYSAFLGSLTPISVPYPTFPPPHSTLPVPHTTIQLECLTIPGKYRGLPVEFATVRCSNTRILDAHRRKRPSFAGFHWPI
jgi:hypothetical protein